MKKYIALSFLLLIAFMGLTAQVPSYGIYDEIYLDGQRFYIDSDGYLRREVSQIVGHTEVDTAASAGTDIVTIYNRNVTATSDADDSLGYSLNIENSPYFRILGVADGSGGVDNTMMYTDHVYSWKGGIHIPYDDNWYFPSTAWPKGVWIGYVDNGAAQDKAFIAFLDPSDITLQYGSIYGNVVFKSGVLLDNDSEGIVSMSYPAGFRVYQNPWYCDSVYIDIQVMSMADDESHVIPSNMAGHGFVMSCDGGAWGEVIWNEAAEVTIIDSSGIFANTNTDGYLCVYDNGTSVIVRNRQDAAKRVHVDLKYFDADLYTP